MPEIKVYFAPDGRVHIYWPKGLMPLESEIKSICDLIEQHRKSPSANGNSQMGSTANSTGGQVDCTIDCAAAQGEYMKVLKEDSAE